MADRALTEDEISKIRSKAKEVFENLEKKDHTPRSWINQGEEVKDDTRSDRCHYFDTHGFIKVEGFVGDKTVKALCQQMEELANQWDPDAGIDSFGTGTKENAARGDYFLESSSKIHFFAETTALQDGKLKPEFQSDKLSALNKSGHAMHMVPGAFQDYARGSAVRGLVLDLGWKDPVVPQSMYIFKQKQIGGTVTSHQDSTFLFTEPKQSCLGLWLALHESTLENGCLWVRPASHWEATRRQYKRNPLHFGPEAIEARTNEPLAPSDDDGDPTSKFVMDQIADAINVPWDGTVPEGGYEALLEAGFVPVECKPGDLLAFNGQLDHLSLPNFSNKPRHTFQLHMVEGPGAGVTWSKYNWLQYPPNLPFMRLLDGAENGSGEEKVGQ